LINCQRFTKDEFAILDFMAHFPKNFMKMHSSLFFSKKFAVIKKEIFTDSKINFI